MSTKRRVVSDIGNPGRFVHQAWYPDSRTWHDIGNNYATRAEAIAAMEFVAGFGDRLIYL